MRTFSSGFALSCILTLAGVPAAAQPRLTSLDNQPVNPFDAPANVKAIAFLFVSVDCPISNRYAPHVRRLHDRFAPQGVLFWLVYPNPAESADTIRRHLQEYGYPVEALRDPRHELVKIARATITPEAAVFDRKGQLIYRGRVDNRYVSLGVERPKATRHDLEEALAAMLAGRPVDPAATQAVGCFIADFVQ
jgi:hypothetical protein